MTGWQGDIASTIAVRNKLHCNKTVLQRRGDKCERMNVCAMILFESATVNLHLRENRILECFKAFEPRLSAPLVRFSFLFLFLFLFFLQNCQLPRWGGSVSQKTFPQSCQTSSEQNWGLSGISSRTSRLRWWKV